MFQIFRDATRFLEVGDIIPVVNIYLDTLEYLTVLNIEPTSCEQNRLGFSLKLLLKASTGSERAVLMTSEGFASLDDEQTIELNYCLKRGKFWRISVPGRISEFRSSFRAPIDICDPPED